MNAKDAEMEQFLLLLKGKKELDYSPEELQRRIGEYRKWVDDIKEFYVTDNRLEREGVHIKSMDYIKTDGPFLEAKEIIAGFIILKSASLEDAKNLALTSPLLKYFEIIVRPIV